MVITAAARPEPPTFAGLLADAIRGGAADRDRDGYIGVDEIFDHLRERDPTVRHWVYGSGRQPWVGRVRKPGSDQMALIAELAAAAAGPDLHQAAQSRATLTRMSTGNDRVAAAASAALRRTSLRVAEGEITFGRVAPGTRQLTVRVAVSGPPLVAASTVTVSADGLHARLEGDQLRVSWFPTVGQLDAVVTIDGPAGSAQVAVRGEVSEGEESGASGPSASPQGVPGGLANGAPGVPAQGVPGVPAQGVPGVPAQGVPGVPAQGVPGVPAQGVPGVSAASLPGSDSPGASAHGFPAGPPQGDSAATQPPQQSTHRVLPPPPPQWYNGIQRPVSGPPDQPTSGAPRHPALSTPVDPWPDAPTSSAPSSGAPSSFHQATSGQPVDPWAAAAGQHPPAPWDASGRSAGHPANVPGQAPLPYPASPTPYQVSPAPYQVSSPPGQLFIPPVQATPADQDTRPAAPAQPDTRPAAPAQPDTRPAAPAQPDTRPAAPAQPDTRPAAPAQPDARPAAPAQPDARPAVPVQGDARPVAPVQGDAPQRDAEADPRSTSRGPWSGRPQRPAAASNSWSARATEETARPSGTWWAQPPEADQRSGRNPTPTPAWPSGEPPTQRDVDSGDATVDLDRTQPVSGIPAEPADHQQTEPINPIPRQANPSAGGTALPPTQPSGLWPDESPQAEPEADREPAVPAWDGATSADTQAPDETSRNELDESPPTPPIPVAVEESDQAVPGEPVPHLPSETGASPASEPGADTTSTEPSVSPAESAAVTSPADIWPGSPAEPTISVESSEPWPSAPAMPTTAAEPDPQRPAEADQAEWQHPGAGHDERQPAGDEREQPRPVGDKEADALPAGTGNSTQAWQVSAAEGSQASGALPDSPSVVAYPDETTAPERWDSVPMDSGGDTVAWQASPAEDADDQRTRPGDPPAAGSLAGISPIHEPEGDAAHTSDSRSPSDDSRTDNNRPEENRATEPANAGNSAEPTQAGIAAEPARAGDAATPDRPGGAATPDHPGNAAESSPVGNAAAGGFVGSWLAAQASPDRHGSEDDRVTPNAAEPRAARFEPETVPGQPEAPQRQPEILQPSWGQQTEPVTPGPTGSWPPSSPAGAPPVTGTPPDTGTPAGMGTPAGPWPGDRADDSPTEQTQPGAGWPMPAAASDSGAAGNINAADPGDRWPAGQNRSGGQPRLPWEAGSAAAAAGGWPRPDAHGPSETGPAGAGPQSAADETTVAGMAASSGWPGANDPTEQHGPAGTPAPGGTAAPGAQFGGTMAPGGRFDGTTAPGAQFGGATAAGGQFGGATGPGGAGAGAGGSIAGSPSGRVSWDGPDDWTRSGGLAGAPGAPGGPAGWQGQQPGVNAAGQQGTAAGGWGGGTPDGNGWQQGTNPAWPTSPAGWPNSPSWQQPGDGPIPPNGVGAPPAGGAPSSRRHLRVVGVLLLSLLLAAGAYLGIRYVSGRKSEPTAQPTATQQQQQPGGGQSAAATQPAEPTEKAPVSLAVPVVVDTINGTGREPEGVVVSPDNRLVYVADQGAKEVFFVGAGDKKVASVAVPNTPRFLALSRDGSKLYVSMFENDFSANALAVIDTAKRSLIKSVKTGPRPFEPAVGADGRVWLPIHNGARVEIYDGTTLDRVQQISVPPNPHWVDFLPDGTRAFTSDHESSRMSVIDARTGRVLNNVTVGRSPHSVAVTPDGKTVLVTNYDVNTVESYDTTTLRLIKRYTVGKLPQAVLVSGDGVHAYVVNEGSDTVSVLNLEDKQVSATIKVGDSPRVIALSPDGRKLYVTAGRDGAVTVLKAAED
ncbi:hypothetical protein ACTOB_002319 [Actinoplanes oblitus]|uniref:YNCE-like beta-propeller domain-containing protein n=1 Tax=Actinoplanes oblitus TaxID=3040509 RepID=A0ABY8WLI8_9ACTN|nr:hypothetical protein [Actinoplanes oblitus]WIM98710.1 hypothetical protein ACTOB_002319 [Actinoplanes oblitus]